MDGAFKTADTHGPFRQVSACSLLVHYKRMAPLCAALGVFSGSIKTAGLIQPPLRDSSPSHSTCSRLVLLSPSRSPAPTPPITMLIIRSFAFELCSRVRHTTVLVPPATCWSPVFLVPIIILSGRVLLPACLLPSRIHIRLSLIIPSNPGRELDGLVDIDHCPGHFQQLNSPPIKASWDQVTRALFRCSSRTEIARSSEASEINPILEVDRPEEPARKLWTLWAALLQLDFRIPSSERSHLP